MVSEFSRQIVHVSLPCWAAVVIRLEVSNCFPGNVEWLKPADTLVTKSEWRSSVSWCVSRPGNQESVVDHRALGSDRGLVLWAPAYSITWAINFVFWKLILNPPPLKSRFCETPAAVSDHPEAVPHPPPPTPHPPKPGSVASSSPSLQDNKISFMLRIWCLECVSVPTPSPLQ